MSHERVVATLAKCRSIAKHFNPDCIEKGEEILSKLAEYLHPNHAICTQLKTGLVSGYAALADKDLPQLNRQLELVQQVLAVTDVIDPGMTPRRGAMLKHLVDVTMKKANIEVEQGHIDKKTHIVRMRSSMMLMKEVMKCCRFK